MKLIYRLKLPSPQMKLHGTAAAKLSPLCSPHQLTAKAPLIRQVYLAASSQAGKYCVLTEVDLTCAPTFPTNEAQYNRSSKAVSTAHGVGHVDLIGGNPKAPLVIDHVAASTAVFDDYPATCSTRNMRFLHYQLLMSVHPGGAS